MLTEQAKNAVLTSGHEVLDRSVKGHEVMRLRLLFLMPLTFAIIAIIAALTLTLYRHEHQALLQGVLRIRASAQGFYEESIRYDAKALQAVMDALKRDRTLQKELMRRDRQALLAHTGLIFDELKRDFAITHLYFTAPDRINLLRVHAPNRYGDRIDRITTLSAEKDGTNTYGVELGPLGTLTLRLVSPWYDESTRELLGYVELGMEIDRVLQKLREFFGVEVFVLVKKDNLDRKEWENGMRALGRTPDWDRFPAVVQASQTGQAIPPLLADRLSLGELPDSNSILEAGHGGASYRIAFLPLQDAAGRKVAHMVLITDVSRETDAAVDTVYVGSLTALVSGLLLLGFFNWQVGRIGRRIESDKQALEQLATHDGLTGLYNHRTFYTLLEEEIARARRFQHPLSLLMIDIDHFKRVNDTYGHQAGDAVLRCLSECLAGQIRVIDRLCRYGGEEIAVILPNSDSADDLAERLRATVEATPFDAGGKAVSITVSIGASSFPNNGVSGQALVFTADAALYAAKQGGRNRVCKA